MDYVDTAADLASLAEALEGSPVLGIDTEAAGYHRYDDRVCLLQASTRTDTFLVDTLAVTDLSPLGPVLGSTETEVVIHDAAYDLRLLSRDFGLSVGGLFDTRIAAQLLGERSVGLANLLDRFLGVKLAKGYQLADWARRPLPAEMREYAAEDTRYLPALRDGMRTALEERGRLHWAEEEFRIQEGVRWDEPDEPAYLGLKRAKTLDRRGLAVLRELVAWRDGLAKERDTALFRVIPDKALVAIAEHAPTSRDELAAVPGMRRTWVKRYAKELTGGVRRALERPKADWPERPPRPKRPPRDPELDRAVDRMRAARAETAEALGLETGVLMPRSQLRKVAEHSPASLEELADVPGVREWQVEAFGDALLNALRNTD